MIKFIFLFCLIGLIIGIIAHFMISLKIRGLCKRRNISMQKKSVQEEIFGFLRIIFISAIPFYNYFLFLCVIFYDTKKLENIISKKVNEYNEDS